MQSKDKRIVKNTLIVYVQLFVSMAVNLVTSRFVLQALGASDYGLFNVVGGVIAMFTFVSGSLLVTTVRFLNYEMGKPDGNVNMIFNQSFILHLLFSIFIFILLESAGLFYILNYLNVDVGKDADAMFVFQISTVVACFSVVGVPFQSLFVAHERFSIIAVVDVVSSVVKLLMVCFLLCYDGNALRLYSIIMAFVILSPFVSYYLMGKKLWPSVVKWNYVKKWVLYKEQISYFNWNLLDTAAMVLRAQGATLLINWFFGTVVNAAYAIANIVLQQVNNFVGKFDVAVAPQITQNLGAGNDGRSVMLASLTCRICVLVMELIFFSLIVELEFILRLWLGDALPEGTVRFCQFTLLVALVSSTSSGLLQLINGLGKIKWFKIQKGIWYLLALFSGYLLFRYDYPPATVVLLFVISDVLCRMTQFFLLKRIYDFDVRGFVCEAYTRPAVVFMLMAVFVVFYRSLNVTGLIASMLGIILTFSVALIAVVLVGLNHIERYKLLNTIMQRLAFRK